MGNIFDSVIRQATPIFNYLEGCSIINNSITYRKYNGQTYDTSIGANKDDYASTSAITCLELFHNEKSAVAAKQGKSKPQSEVQVGDRVFVFFSGLPDNRTFKDQIVVSDGTIYNIKSILDIREFATFITVES